MTSLIYTWWKAGEELMPRSTTFPSFQKGARCRRILHRSETLRIQQERSLFLRGDRDDTHALHDKREGRMPSEQTQVPEEENGGRAENQCPSDGSLGTKKSEDTRIDPASRQGVLGLFVGTHLEFYLGGWWTVALRLGRGGKHNGVPAWGPVEICSECNPWPWGCF
ncbi:hypothetical protein K461DRAFT_271528 [Myriangium duriaei CBS 260.36]|uniref:Uncharacterized protein n=1 Tax=Myriangium duriaei CBS 260.36 TaxID=1168546 RepID=A0A9P4IY22_9PEZI|nr:hypothetical protein K461DRAFT_271528 [Myriangium duriaei CBS 260.36]